MQDTKLFVCLQILMALQAVVSKCEEPPNKFSDSIKQVTHTLTGSVNNQLEQVRLDMLKMVSQECNSVVASKVSLFLCRYQHLKSKMLTNFAVIL